MKMGRRWIAIACAGTVLGAACSHGSSNHSSPTTTAASATNSASVARTTHVLAIGSTSVQRAGGLGRISRATQRNALASAQRYVNAALLAPLETGKVGPGYSALFDAGIRPAATGADLAVLTDLAVGRTQTSTEAVTPVALSGLADQSGTLLYVATNFRVTVHATRPSGPVTIDRTVELTLTPVGRTWLIAAYLIKVRRTGPAPAAKSPPKKKPPAKKPTPTTRKP